MRLYHNPRCSKSRATLSLLQEHGHQPEVIEYLKETPSLDDLHSLQKALNKAPLEWMRTGESIFKELGLSAQDSRSDQDWLELMHQHPILIERPILVKGSRAAIGRPPEAVLDIL